MLWKWNVSFEVPDVVCCCFLGSQLVEHTVAVLFTDVVWKLEKLSFMDGFGGTVVLSFSNCLCLLEFLTIHFILVLQIFI